MDKGIRNYANRTFLGLVPRLAELGNRQFRRSVLDSIKEAFDLSELQAATHYNHAFKEARKTHAEFLTGLGRPEDKKGGRKRKSESVAGDTEPQPIAVDTEEVAGDTEPQPSLFTVIRVKDGHVVAQDLNRAEAEQMVERAARQKKARLQVV